jgi:hypothetical protein
VAVGPPDLTFAEAVLMKTMLIAGLVITSPAILLLFFYMGTMIAVAAAASLAVNSIPFLVAGFLMRKGGDGSDEDSH